MTPEPFAEGATSPNTPRPVGRGPAVLLLRHAWAVERDLWDGADHERPLDGRGRAQAQALPGHLAALRLVPVHLVATPTERSNATLRPLARDSGLSIHDDERFTDVRPPVRCDDGWGSAAWLAVRALDGLNEVVRHVPAQAPDAPGPDESGLDEAVVVVCSHGEVLPALLAGLGARDGWRLERGPDLSRKAMPKGGGWLLSPGAHRVVVIEPPVIPETTDPGSA
jgi:broad specificity phosphatase PhoE